MAISASMVLPVLAHAKHKTLVVAGDANLRQPEHRGSPALVAAPPWLAPALEPPLRLELIS